MSLTNQHTQPSLSKHHLYLLKHKKRKVICRTKKWGEVTTSPAQCYTFYKTQLKALNDTKDKEAVILKVPASLQQHTPEVIIAYVNRQIAKGEGVSVEKFLGALERYQ